MVRRAPVLIPGANVIIFGLSVFYIFGLIGTGTFHCPNCGGDRDY